MEEETLEELDGSIQSVHVQNFFCHENLEVNFNKNVNFIVGCNGSGKSAILTALVVGLGGRAAATNRGNSLTSFIRNGANSATVEIKIQNSSPKAYKHHVYGDTITVIRTINASGGSGYKIKSAKGEIISTKYEEVNAIILAHNIQVDNPISVLNQDDARSFHASDPNKKYALFRKATNLDQTETNYRQALEYCEKASKIWKRKTEASKELEKELKKWESSYEQLQSRDEIEQQKQQLQNEYYWSEIAELEGNLETVQTQYVKQQKNIDQLVQKLNKLEQNYGNNNNLIETLKAQIQEKSSERSALEREISEMEKGLQQVQTQCRIVQGTAGKMSDVRNREKRKVNDLEHEINAVQSGSLASRRESLAQSAESLAAAARSAASRYATAQHEAEQARANAAHAHAAKDKDDAAVRRQGDAIKQLKQQVRELEHGSGSELAVYGVGVADLCRHITNNGRMFSAPPRGPIGAYIKVKEKKWAGALEHILGASVSAFCVNTPEDSRKLFLLMEKVLGPGPKPSVTCSKFLPRAHDVSRSEVRAGAHCSALAALQVSDPVVANYLIDNLSLEKILLVPDHEEAIRRSEKVENVPKNCGRTVTLDGSEYYPAPAYRSYGGAGRRPRLLQVSSKERQSQLMAELKEAESTLRDLESKAKQSSEEAKSARLLVESTSRALQALLSERHAKEAAARAATAALDAVQPMQHKVLLEELEVSKEKLKSVDAQLEQLTEQETGLKAQVDEFDAKLTKLRNKMSKANIAIRTISEELDQEQLKLDQGSTERQMITQRLAEDQQKMARVDAILADKMAVIETKKSEALQLCPKVEDPRDKALVYSELKKTQLKLSAIRSDGLSKAQVAERLVAVQHRYTATKQRLQQLEALIRDIEKASRRNLHQCSQVQTYIARKVQFCFQSILELRGYSGRMDIDEVRSSLQLYCSGRDSGSRRVATSTSSLSGGERSFAMVAFIMALWDCVALPFYFMDEFDVFMDPENRKAVMELLVFHALENTNKQFVFLTPQDASSVSAGPLMKIHRMADPRR